MDAAALKQKANQKMRVLEQERDCFREMSKDLDIKLKEEIKNNKDLREEVRIYKDELDNYKKICFSRYFLIQNWKCKCQNREDK